MNLIDKSGQILFFRVVERSFAGFGLLCAFIASLAVLVNDAYYIVYHGLTPSVALFLLAFIVGLLSAIWGLALVVGLLPLTAGIPNLLNTLLGTNALAMPNPGLDLVAGLLLANLIKQLIVKDRQHQSSSRAQNSWLVSSPWPLGLVMLVITASVVLAIPRNIYLSATSTSLRGVLFNLIHFRPMDWHADYLPLGNWVAYALAIGLIILVITTLKFLSSEKKNSWIFRSLMLGLAISAITGLIQVGTGLGLSDAQLQFRKDAFGYAAIGLQPDLHAFAAHMLLGVVGLWGYFLVCKNKAERSCIVILFLLCTVGLIASKSRASLIIAFITLVVIGLIYLYRHSKKFFVVLLIFFIAIVCVFLLGAGSIPGLAWVGELMTQIQSRRLDSLSDLGGMMGSRFEIWSAVANMFSAYPLMGVGEGEFYRLSSNISFARSEFLQLNRGENAHNYFLQVLAENGLVGVAVFAIAFIVPYRTCQNKQLILPAAVGLLSLFLGNIFAHSFLVRENLLLGATLLGLLYSFSGAGASNAITHAPLASVRTRLLGLSAVFGLLVGVAIEVISSFGKIPFKAGADCFVKDVRSYPDGWTSGAWEELLPKGTKSLELVALPNRINIQKHTISGRLEMLVWIPGRGKVPVNVRDYEWTTNVPMTLRLDMPAEYDESPHVKSARLQLNSCYTPRNLGVNTDSRRLGVQIKNVQWK
ncbi:O-antigen ligase [Polynucleobacter sp. IMCC 29146]|uniref:O-antigen ligase family protein n=1 Tax=Polynucleobacter sp. IMCC 29146 TaxID=2780953 RepID=UPI001F43AB7A|nr:O-antigen ligase family protein [Polynucleobacter sp. IMCC 29146]MCE7530516.1 O-antigen ligase family protein [Polynucleobacter sp. IMCC 29146]